MGIEGEILDGVTQRLKKEPKDKLIRIIRIGIILLCSIVSLVAGYWFKQAGRYIDSDTQWKQDMMDVQRETLNEITSIKQDQYIMRVQMDTMINAAVPQVQQTLKLIQRIGKEMPRSAPQPARVEPEPLTTIQGKHDAAMTLLNDVEQGITARPKEIKKNDSRETDSNI